MDEVNILYWQGVAVGTEAAGVIQWYPSAPREAIAALTKGES
jgi:hypothetical protein